MKYSNINSWVNALWDTNSPEATEVVDKMVEASINEQCVHAMLTIHLKGGRAQYVRLWVKKETDITEHRVWKSMVKWFNDTEDNTPCSLHLNNYHTFILKSEVTQIELKGTINE